MDIFNGIKVFESSLPIFKRPKFQLSPEFADACSPELRDSTNAWMREFFGEEEVCYVMPQQGFAIMSSKHMAMLRNFTSP